MRAFVIELAEELREARIASFTRSPSFEAQRLTSLHRTVALPIKKISLREPQGL